MAVSAKSKKSLDTETRLTLIDINLISINGTRHLPQSEAEKGKYSTEGGLQVSVEERNGEQVVCVISSAKTIGTTTKARKRNVPAFELEIAIEAIFEIGKSSNIKTLEDINDSDAFHANQQINTLLVTAINQNLALMGFGGAAISYKIGAFSSID